MSLAEVERNALEPSEKDRTSLAATLLESVAPDFLEHRADEFERRERKMNEGTVEEISYEELLKRSESGTWRMRLSFHPSVQRDDEVARGIK
jgi:hypothetical protein